MSNTIFTTTERTIMQRGLIAAKRQLKIALMAKPGSAIFESAPSIQGRIAYLEAALSTAK